MEAEQFGQRWDIILEARERCYQRHKAMFDRAGYSEEQAMKELNTLVEDLVNSASGGVDGAVRVAQLLDNMVIEPPKKRKPALTEQTQQVLDEIERTLKGKLEDSQRQKALAWEDRSETRTKLHQGEEGAYISALRIVERVRLTLGADTGAQGDTRRGGVAHEEADAHDVA